MIYLIDELINEIYEEVKPTFEADTANFYINFKDVVRLLIDVLYLSNHEGKNLGKNLEVSIATCYLEHNKNEKIKALQDIALSLEPFAKLVLFHSKGKQAFETFENKREQAFRKKTPIPCYYQELGLRQAATQNSQLHKSIQPAKKLRNAFAHNTLPNYTRKEIAAHLETLMTVYLFCTAKYCTPLKRATLTNNEQHFTQYLQDMRHKYKLWKDTFVAIDGKEFEFVEGKALEQFDVNNLKHKHRIKRKDTVENLMLYKVPEKRMLVLGAAGTGKTTTFQYLTFKEIDKYEQKERKAVIPVYLELNMSKSDVTIEERIATALRTDANTAREMLKNGRIRLFLDGLNEVNDGRKSSLRKNVSLDIKQFLDKYPKTFVLISCRPTDSAEFLDVPAFELQPMDKKKISEFLDKNCSNENSKSMIKTEIATYPKLLDILATPLLLARLIDIVDETGSMPEKNETKIMGVFLECLLQREENEKQADISYEKTTILLRRLGYETLYLEQFNFTIDDILNYWKPIKQDYGFQFDIQDLVSLLCKLNILSKKPEHKYAFAHQKYQDYYCGLEESIIDDESEW